MNLAACGSLIARAENRVWFRALQPQHLQTALATGHTRRIPSRFSPATGTKPAFPILYLAENHQVALFEVGAMLGSPLHGVHVPNPHQAWVILNVQANLQVIVDLTDLGEQQKLLTTAQERTGDWQGYQLRRATTSVSQPTGPAPTQLLGAALYGVAGLEGFLTISARVPTHMGLVVFPDNLQPGSSAVFADPTTNRIHTIAPKGRRRR
jgi:hypothetical protein